MKAFWWFKENSIAGMARPGFNSVRWFDLPFAQAVLLGWLGQYSEGPAPLTALDHHIKTYVPKIYTYHKMDEITGQQATRVLSTPDGVLATLKTLSQHLNVLKSFHIENNSVYFQLSDEVLNQEIGFLKQNDIRGIITLTERHHQKDILSSHFNTHHISIVDLGAPNLEQARHLADIVMAAQAKKEKLAVHCLAGIGRTSTLLIAAHILLGETLPDLEARIAKQNPYFAFSGPQAEFLRSIHLSSFS